MKKNGASLLLILFIQLICLSAQAEDYYWIGGSGDWNDLEHWSDQPGGSASYVYPPNEDDDVYFDEYSFPDASAEVIVNIPADCKNMYWGDVSNMPTLKTDDSDANYLTIHGGATFNDKMILDLDRTLYFNSSSSGNEVDFGGITFDGDIQFGNNGGWRITSEVNLINNTIYFIQGTLSIEADITCGAFMSEVTASRVLYLNSSILTLDKSGSSVLSIQSDNLTLDAGDSKINIISSNSTFETSGADALEFYDLNFSGDKGSIESSALLSSFNDITFELDGSMQGENDIQDLTFTAGHTYSISSSGTQNINGTFQALGECYDYILLAGDVFGGNISAEVVDLDYLKVENINASGTAIPFDATNSYDLGGNNTNWTFTEPSSEDYTWTGGAGDGMWGSKDNWDVGCVPSRNNNVIIGASYTVEIDVAAECKGLAIDDASTLEGSEDLDIYGSLAAGNCTWNYSGETQFSGDDSNTISFNGNFIGLVTFSGDGTWTLASDITVDNILDLEQGNLITDTYTITSEQFSSTSSYSRSLDISNSTFEITSGVSQAWNIQGSGLSLTSNNSEIVFSENGAEMYHNTSDGLDYGTVSFSSTEGQALLTNEGVATQPHFESLEFVGNAKLTGDHQFDKLIFSQGKEYSFEAGSTQKILVADGLIAHGTCSEYITFTGNGGVAYFDCDVNSTDLYRLRIEDVNVSGGIGSLTANESIGISGYEGWVFLDDLTGSTIYWTGDTDNDWFTATNWEGDCLPTRLDTVVFRNDKVTNTYEVNISSTSDDAECASMIWTNADLMSFSGNQPISIFGSLDFSGMTDANFAYSGDFYFKSETGDETIDAGAVSLLGDLYFEGNLQEDDSWSAGSWTLQSELNTEGSITLENGDLISNDYNMEASSFASNFLADQPRSLSLGSSTFTLESFTVTPDSLTLNAGTSEIIFNTAGELVVSEGSDTDSYPLEFYNVSFNEADGNAYVDIYSDDISFNNLVFSGNTYFRKTNDSEISFVAESIQMAVGKTYEFESNQTFIFTDITADGACEGSIDITGSSSDPAIFQANTGVTEITVSSVNLLNVNAEPEDVFIAKESIDLGGTDGWSFEDEPEGTDLYWILGTGNWDDPGHWATTSGALVADGCVPTVKDNVFFDDGSFGDTEQTVYTGASDIRCRTMDWTGSEAARPNFEMGDTDITGVYIYGSLILNSTVEIDLSAMVDFYFRATEAQEIETFGYLFPNAVEFDGSGGEWTLQDSLTVEGDVYIRSGELISGGNYIECKSLSSTDGGESSRGLDIQNSNVTITGTEDELGFSLNIYLPDAYYDQGFELLADGSTITFTDEAKVYIAGINKQDIEFNKIVFEEDGIFSSYKVNGFTPYVEYLQFEQNGGVSGYNEFGTIELARGYDFEFEDGITYEMDYFLAEGSCFAPISIHSSEDGTQTTISSANDVSGDFLELQDIAGDTSGGTTYTASNSFAISNVTGWITDEEIAPISLYWVGNGDDDLWNNYENWSRSEDGSEEGCVPTLNDDVFFTSSSFLGSKYVELINDGKCHSMTWSDDVDATANFSVYANLQMAGSMDLTENMSMSMSGTFEFVGDGLTDDKEIDFADKSMNGDIIFDGDDQSWIWTSGLTTTGDLYLESGSVSTEGNDFTIGRFSSLSLDDYDAVRKFDMSGSIVSVTSDETTAWNMIVNTTGGLEFIATDTGITFENGGGIYCTTDTEVSFGFIDFMDNGVININGDGSGNFGSVEFHEQGQVYGDNTFTNLEFTLGYKDNTIESGKTITISGELTMEGVNCSFVYLRASNSGETAYINKPSGYFDEIYDASFTDISGSSGSGGDHPVYYYYDDNGSSTGFYQLDDTDEDGDGELEEDAPSFESSFENAREEYCSDVAVLDFVESFPINSSTTFVWYYSVDGTDGTYTEIDGETSTTIDVDATGFYKVEVIYGLNSGSGTECSLESVIEVILGAVSNVSLEITSTNVTCYGLGDGRITAQVVADEMYPDYTFFWKDEEGASVTNTTLATDGKSTASNLDPGKYYITVADSKSCEFDTLVNIFEAYELVLESIDTTNLTCYTIPEGEIVVTASGGTGDLSYFLNGDVQESDTISGLYSGEYLVYVQDENSCTTETDTVELTSNPEITLELNGSDLLCYGDSNGEFAPIVTGGVPDYTYSWTGPDSYTSTSASISGLAGGTYELTVTDAVDCPSVRDTVLLEPEKLTTTELTVDAVNCNGESSGEVFVVATQGTPDYVYSIDDLESNSGIFTDLASGDYTVHIVDANSCVYDTTVTVTEPGIIQFEIEDVVLPTCENTNDGIIQITPYGGNSGYTFSWSGPDDYRSYSQNLENLAAGDYTLRISDLKNCTGEGEVDLNLGYTIQLGLVVEQDVTTAGGNDGILTIETSEGTTPYSFTISGPDGYSYSSPSGYDNSSSTIENLAAGVYTVVATDDSGCSTVEKSIIIDEPGELYVYIEEIQAVGCADSPVGELKARASGGTETYTYSWSSTSGYSGSGQTISGLADATYTLTVTSGSQTATASYELVAPDALSVSVASVVNVTCNNEANGEIELEVDAGSADYTIEWTSDDGFLSSAEHILDLEPGTYNYTITTEYGCSVSGSETISEPSSLDLSVTTDNYSGAGTGDGKLSATVTGGTSPYTFLVSGPSDYSYAETNTSGTISINGLLKGFYEVVVLDANECRIEGSDKVYETDILVLFTSSITSVTCPGGSDGAITVDYLGESDSTNISFSWTGDNYFRSTDQNVSGLKAGDYTVTITDSEGDTGFESQSLEITVSEPDELLAEYWKQDITCYGLTDGYINLHPQGGTPSYTYSWTGTGVIADNEDQQALSAGTYTIQITDSLGCVSETETITIEEPSQVLVTVSDYSEPSCYGLEDGWITLDISEGSGPYLINWDDYGSISEDIYELETGEYSFVVTDNNGCETVDTIQLNQPDSLIAEINDYQDVLCNGEKSAYAIVDVSGGTPTYTFTWSDGQDTDEASDLGIGRYEVTVVDEHGCSDTSSVEITQPDALVLKVEATRPTTIDAYDGSIRIDVSGGVEDYNINWLDGDGIYFDSGLTVEDLDADTYTVTVVDENSCELDSIIVLDYLYETRIKIPKAFTPNGDGYNDYWDLERIEYVQDLKIVIYDRWGKAVYKFSGTGNEYRGDPWTGEDGNSNVPIGSYYYAVELNDEKPLMGTVTILR